ncbi:hypothetical protein BDD12DRAFT_343782 [Trichophaea hybrida]|nr:hypothetical protein BDD12DRAFT_343782 [Trichophaea hybrida]
MEINRLYKPHPPPQISSSINQRIHSIFSSNTKSFPSFIHFTEYLLHKSFLSVRIPSLVTIESSSSLIPSLVRSTTFKMQMRICHSLIVAIVSLGGLASAAPSNYLSGTTIGRPCDSVPCAPHYPPPCATPSPAPYGYSPKPCGCAEVVKTTVIATPPCAPAPCAPKPYGFDPAPYGIAPVKIAEAAPVEVAEAAPAAEVVKPEVPCKRQCGCPCKCDVVQPTITKVNPAIVNTSTDVQPVDIIQPVQGVVQPVIDKHIKPVYSETVNAPEVKCTVEPCTCGGCAPTAPAEY